MLVLSRKADQQLLIGNEIRIVVQRVVGNRVVLGIEAPPEVHVMRGELRLKERQSAEFSDDFVAVDPQR